MLLFTVFIYVFISAQGFLFLRKIKKSQDIIINHFDNLQSSFNVLDCKVDVINRGMKDGKGLEDGKSTSKRISANRRPRTQEQRKMASEKRRKWWEEKRRAQGAVTLPEQIETIFRIPSQSDDSAGP